MAPPGKALDLTKTFWSVGCAYRSRFERFLRVLNGVYFFGSPVLASPVLLGTSGDERLSAFKRFCSAPLERLPHVWDAKLHDRKVGRRDRFAIHVSLFLFRKNLPSSIPSIDAYISKTSSEASPADPDFIGFCEKEIHKLFRRGWDRKFVDSCLTHTVNTSSCMECPRRKGGCRNWFLGKSDHESDIARSSVVESALTGLKKSSYAAKIAIVPTDGKYRILSVGEADLSMLKPLHTIFYNHLSLQPWLLRGDAKAARFKDFCAVKGELFVSGDYESATDNLNLATQKEILRLVLQRCRYVPNVVMLNAMTSLSLDLTFRSKGLPTRRWKQTQGQMMGSYLSFPLLCLVNYLAFRYFVGRDDVPVRINGDDIVFRATRAEYQKWEAGCKIAGLTLSKGKTLVDRSFFTLNSTLFQGCGSSVKLIPVIRSKTLFGVGCNVSAGETPITSIPGRFKNFATGFTGARASYLRDQFLRINSRVIERSGRSVVRGLGLNVRPDELISSGLWRREISYLEPGVSEKDIPAPISEWSHPPAGYKFVRRNTKPEESDESRRGLRQAFVEAAWRPMREVPGQYEDSWIGGLHIPISRERDLYKLRKLVGMGRSDCLRWLKPDRSLFRPLSAYGRVRGYWVPESTRTLLHFTTSSGELYPLTYELSGQSTVRNGRTSGSEDNNYSPPKCQLLERGVLVSCLRREQGFFVSHSGVGIGPPCCLPGDWGSGCPLGVAKHVHF
jgi:hypothetical protein